MKSALAVGVGEAGALSPKARGWDWERHLCKGGGLANKTLAAAGEEARCKGPMLWVRGAFRWAVDVDAGGGECPGGSVTSAF